MNLRTRQTRDRHGIEGALKGEEGTRLVTFVAGPLLLLLPVCFKFPANSTFPELVTELLHTRSPLLPPVFVGLLLWNVQLNLLLLIPLHRHRCPHSPIPRLLDISHNIARFVDFSPDKHFSLLPRNPPQPASQRV
jgi:hypothetical protein